MECALALRRSDALAVRRMMEKGAGVPMQPCVPLPCVYTRCCVTVAAPTLRKRLNPLRSAAFVRQSLACLVET